MKDPASIKIKAEPLQTDPNTCRFTVNDVVWEGPPAWYKTPEAGQRAPLARAVFAVDGVTTVLVSGDVVTVTKRADVEWPQVMRPIGAAIRATLAADEPAIVPPDEGDLTPDDRIRLRAQQVLDEAINPYVETHGGNISIDGVRDATIYVRMSGGCQGCGSASVTLRQGVEAMLFEEIPELREVVDVTNHAEGENPYYAAQK